MNKYFNKLRSYIDANYLEPDSSVRYSLRKDNSSNNIKHYVEKELQKSMNFSNLLAKFMIDKGFYSKPELYKKACIDRRHFHKLTNDKVIPKKETVLALAIALQLNLTESERLMESVGYAFSPCKITDLVIRFFLDNGIYDRFEIDEALVELGEAPLTG